MKAFVKAQRGLLIALLCALAAAGYAYGELCAIPQTFQRVFLPAAQTARTDGETAPANQYIRDLQDTIEPIAQALEGSCAPLSLYAVAQPASVSAEKQKRTADARLVGVDGSYFALEPIALYGGRLFYPDEYLYGERVALVDEQLAVALFQYAEPVLEELTVGGLTYRIIGIVRDHKRVGDEMEYSLYVPLRSLVKSDAAMTAMVLEAAPVAGSGGWAAFSSATANLGQTGTSLNLVKESMNAKMPLRLLAVGMGAALAFSCLAALNRRFGRLVAGYRERLQSEYASRLLGWFLLRGAALTLGYAVCAYGLARLFVLLVAPVYTFPEWVPAVLVEPKDIAAAFWNVWQKPAALVELRTPELLRVRFFATLMGWACGLCACFGGVLWGAATRAGRRGKAEEHPTRDRVQ